MQWDDIQPTQYGSWVCLCSLKSGYLEAENGDNPLGLGGNVFSDRPISWRVTNYFLWAAILKIGLINMPIIVSFWDVHWICIDLKKLMA